MMNTAQTIQTLKLNAATNAIRNLQVECNSVAQILSTLACKMKDCGFSTNSVEMIDQVSDQIGQKTCVHQDYSFRTTTGQFNLDVDVYFDVSDSGDIEDLEVMFYRVNLYGVISEDQKEEIERQAWQFYLTACESNNDDLRINNYLSSL